MNKQYSLNEKLGLEIEINRKKFDLIATDKDIENIIEKGLQIDIGLYNNKDQKPHKQSTSMKHNTNLYYHTNKIIVKITPQEVLEGLFDFSLRNLFCWDIADETHIPANKEENIHYSMITISNIKDKGIAEIIKTAAIIAWRNNKPN